jgi:hypothetical protein
MVAKRLILLVLLVPSFALARIEYPPIPIPLPTKQDCVDAANAFWEDCVEDIDAWNQYCESLPEGEQQDQCYENLFEYVDQCDAEYQARIEDCESMFESSDESAPESEEEEVLEPEPDPCSADPEECEPTPASSEPPEETESSEGSSDSSETSSILTRND